jgi:5-formyltetrahydrofolate cyclo-ligase
LNNDLKPTAQNKKIKMTKEEIRILYKQKRRGIGVAEKNKLEDLMLIQFQRLPIEIKNSIMSYAPIEVQNEFNPELILDYCNFKVENLIAIFPKIDTETDTMKSYIIHEGSFFEKNRYGISEPVGGIRIFPEDIKMMFVPLLAFDTNGNRVGYGKGYYDKFIKLCAPSMIKIGFSFFDPVVIDDVSAIDEKLDFCITPERIYEF